MAQRPEGSDAELAELNDRPVDLAELHADDALLDALGGTDPDLSSSRDQDIEHLLVAWRREVDAAPITELVDVDTAAATIQAAQAEREVDSRSARRRRHLVPIATAAAVLMIGFTGVSVAARDALPGDMLWGVAQVFYADHTRAVQAANAAHESLDTASMALDRGQYSQVPEALGEAREHMRDVDAEHGLANLEAAHSSLSEKYDRAQQQPTRTSTPSSTTTEEPPPPPPPPFVPSPSAPPSAPPSSSTAPPSTTEPPPTQTNPPTTTTSGNPETSTGGSWGSNDGLFGPRTQ